MRRLVSVLAIAATAAIGLAPVRAQEPRTSSGDVQLSASEVLLDVVVTDKKGRPVSDVKPGEVEVFENGEKQSVTSFGLVRVGAAGAAEVPLVANALAVKPDASGHVLLHQPGSRVRLAAQRSSGARLVGRRHDRLAVGRRGQSYRRLRKHGR